MEPAACNNRLHSTSCSGSILLVWKCLSWLITGLTCGSKIFGELITMQVHVGASLSTEGCESRISDSVMSGRVPGSLLARLLLHSSGHSGKRDIRRTTGPKFSSVFSDVLACVLRNASLCCCFIQKAGQQKACRLEQHATHEVRLMSPRPGALWKNPSALQEHQSGQGTRGQP